MKFGAILMMLILFLSPSGCGKDGCENAQSAPAGSTITINPTDVTITDGGATTNWHTTFFAITVNDSGGKPMNKAKIAIFFQWAVPDWYGLVQLYDGSTPMNSPFDTCTDDFGTYNLRFDYQSGGGWEYNGNLEIFSGTVYNSTEFKVETGS